MSAIIKFFTMIFRFIASPRGLISASRYAVDESLINKDNNWQTKERADMLAGTKSCAIPDSCEQDFSFSMSMDFKGLCEELLPVGWQPWEGGTCPVPYRCNAIVIRRNGVIEKPSIIELGWLHLEQELDEDILAYRIDC